MLAKDIMKTHVITVSPSVPITEAALLMRDEDIGALVVVDDERNPVGIITDRDIVVSIIADRGNPEEILVKEVMTKKPGYRKLDHWLKERKKMELEIETFQRIIKAIERTIELQNRVDKELSDEVLL
jgi:CBS domain-containing protein